MRTTFLNTIAESSVQSSKLRSDKDILNPLGKIQFLEVTVNDIQNANKVMENKSKEEIVKIINFDSTQYTNFKQQLSVFSKAVTDESLSLYKQNPKTHEMLNIIYKLSSY